MILITSRKDYFYILSHEERINYDVAYSFQKKLIHKNIFFYNYRLNDRLWSDPKLCSCQE